MGLFGFVFLLIAKGWTTLVVSTNSRFGSEGARWGVDLGPAFQTGAELVLLTALGGMVYAAFRAAPLRYTPFAVPDQMDETSFAAAQMPTTSLPCPNCGIRRPYDKGDYFFGSGGAHHLDDLAACRSAHD